VVIVVNSKEALLLLLNLGEKAVPTHDIVLVFVVEDHLCMDEILNDLLAAAILQELCPRGLDAHTLLVMVRKRVHV